MRTMKIQEAIEDAPTQECPYNIVAEARGGRQVFGMKSVEGFVIKLGEPIVLSNIITHNDGSVRFLVENNKYESLICYDTRREAINDGWDI